MIAKNLILIITPCAVCAFAQAEFASEYEDFGSLTNVDQSSWIVNAFNNSADIKSDGSDSLGVHSGPFYDLNLNGNPDLDAALANNGFNESTFINFYDGYEWTSFSGLFSSNWNQTSDAQVRFTFSNDLTLESSTIWADLTNNYDALAALSFDLDHTFNRIEIFGDFVVMDNLSVAIPSPSALGLALLSGLARRRRDNSLFVMK